MNTENAQGLDLAHLLAALTTTAKDLAPVHLVAPFPQFARWIPTLPLPLPTETVPTATDQTVTVTTETTAILEIRGIPEILTTTLLPEEETEDLSTLHAKL